MSLAAGDAVGPLSDEHLDDRALAARAAQHQDADSFALLYRRHVKAVFALAYRQGGSRAVAEDVTSATFERAWKAMPSFEWRGGGFGAWVLRIAATEAAAYHRQQQRASRPRGQLALRELSLELGQRDPWDNQGADITGALAQIRSALGRLHPRYREAITLRYLGGLDAEQAAAALGCSKPVLAVTLHRALGALRKAINEDRAAEREARR